MELSNLKFSNIDRKRIFNTGKLPGFADGYTAVINASNAASNTAALTSSLPKPGQFNISGAQTGVLKLLNQTPNIQTNTALTTTNRYISPITTGLFMQDTQKQLNLFVNTPVRGESKNLGSQAAGSAAAIHPGFAVGSWLGGGVLEGINAFRKSSDEYLAEAGTSQANINGISYTKLNNVNTDLIMSEYDSEAETAWLTNPGKAISMLFGRGAAKRRAELAANYANIQQTAQRDNAYTQFLQLDAAKKYGDTRTLSLYGAANGKLPRFVGGKPTFTVAGATNMEPNSKLSGGEIAYNKAEGIASEVGGPANNKDQEYGYLRASDGVLSNKPGLFGYSPADMFRATGDINSAEDYMIASNMAKGKRMFKCGKLPRFEEGWLSNFIPSAIGTLMSLDQILQASRNRPYKPNTYAANPYELEGLSTLAGLRVNPYPMIQLLKNAETRLNRAVDMSGGLSSALRASSRLSALNTTQNNIANVYSNVQNQNNLYNTQYAQAILNAGDYNRKYKIATNQWDLDEFSKAHARNQKGVQTGLLNVVSQGQGYIKREFERNQFNDMLSIYKGDLQQRQADAEWRNKYMDRMAQATLTPSNNYNTTSGPNYIKDLFSRLPFNEKVKLLNEWRMFG